MKLKYTIIEQRKTISSNSNTSKILLIILGVLVAVIVAFSSRAFGTNHGIGNWEENAGAKIEQEAKEILEKSSSRLSKSLIDSQGESPLFLIFRTWVKNKTH